MRDVESKEYLQFVMKRKDSQVVYTIGVNSTWPEVIEEFVNFLRGAGYQIGPGSYTEDYTYVSNEKLEALENLLSSQVLAD